MEPLSGDVTRLLQQVREGVKGAKDQLVTLLYDEIYRIARAKMRKERRNHTLQPTAVVNEAYIKLIEQTQQCWQGRAHFMAVCARIIRNILVDYARKRNADKRGGDIEFVPLDESIVGLKGKSMEEELAVHEALERLEKIKPQRGRIFELFYYGGMTDEEIAEVLDDDISDRTVGRERERARAWLISELYKK